MANVRRLWVNVLLLLLTQRGYEATTLTSIATTTNSIHSTSTVTVKINDTSTSKSSSNSIGQVLSTSTLSYSIVDVVSESSLSTSSFNTISTETRTSLSGSSVTTRGSLSSQIPSSSTAVSSTTVSRSAVFPTSTVARDMNNSLLKSKTTTSDVLSVVISSTVLSGTPKDHDEDSEPKESLYVWQLVAIGCGVLIFFLLLIIVLSCCQIRVLRKKLRISRRSYSPPIKENGAWIDSQDIPLWQKRASAFVSETPTAESAPTLTT